MTELVDAIVTYVERKDYVTFAELQQDLAAQYDTTGMFALTLDHPTLVLWAGMSERFVDALTRALDANRIYLHPASVMTYWIDGGALNLPIAKRPPKAGYRSEHWLPACLRTVPYTGDA